MLSAASQGGYESTCVPDSYDPAADVATALSPSSEMLLQRIATDVATPMREDINNHVSKVGAANLDAIQSVGKSVAEGRKEKERVP